MSTSTDSKTKKTKAKLPVERFTAAEAAEAHKPDDTVEEVPWHPLVGAGFALVVFIVAQFTAALIIVMGYSGLHHVSGQAAITWLTHSTEAQFSLASLDFLLTLTALRMFVKHYDVDLSIVGMRRPKWSDIAYGFAAVVPYFLAVTLVLLIAKHVVPGLNVDQKQELGFDSAVGFSQLAMVGVSLVILPPIKEELLARGFIYGSLKKGFPIIVAVLTTSALFAAGHLSEGGAAGPLYVAAIITFVLSLFLIGLREITGGLWAGIILHMLQNAIAFIDRFIHHIG